MERLVSPGREDFPQHEKDTVAFRPPFLMPPAQAEAVFTEGIFVQNSVTISPGHQMCSKAGLPQNSSAVIPCQEPP